ncbi:MAG: phosphate signaling complex protein PhoU [Gammaproteobacteria bacterium]|nr:phosphate signaling complex protein PhoU [Gammaproteobacteria bacterium]
MASTKLPTHIFHQFDKELEDIRTKVLSMGGLVEEHLAHVLDALSHGNAALAETIAQSDYKVNAFEVDIDEECTEILARRNPAAGDLRLVLAVTKIITDLERVGDEAEKIARIVASLIANENPKSYYIGVLAMGHHVRRMLHDALDAFARMDADAALAIAKEDREVDREQDATLRQLITYMMEDPRSITRVLNVILAVRAMERIGDHARNICEDVIYLVIGKDIRHISLEDAEKELRGIER